MFKDVYSGISKGTNKSWNDIKTTEDKVYNWDKNSTYIHSPPYFEGMTKDTDKIVDINGAYALLNLGDAVTTDHISPAGSIAVNSPAARYLES